MLPKPCRMQLASTLKETGRLPEHVRGRMGSLPLVICLGAQPCLRQKHEATGWQCMHFRGAPSQEAETRVSGKASENNHYSNNDHI